MSTEPAATDAMPRHPYLTLFLVSFASFMDLLDVNIVTVVIPTMQKELSATYSQGQWFLVAYVVSFAVVLVTGGRLGDIFGRKRIFLIGVAGFTLLSLACALAQSPEMLIGSRLLQGAFGALMTPQVFALMQVLFPPERRGLAFLVYGGVINLGQLAAPILGGVLTTYDLFGLGWRTIFLINVPVGALILIGAGLLVRETKSERPLRFDPVGIVLVALITGLLMYPLHQGREHGWPGWMIGMLIAAVPLLVIFAVVEHRRGHHAVVPTSMFRRRSFTGATILLLLFFSTISSANLVIVWFSQIALGWTPLRTAVSLIGFVLGLMFIGVWTAQNVNKFGRRTVAGGSLLTAIGMGTLSVLIGHFGPDVQPWQLTIAFFVVGCGMAFVVGLLVNAQLYEVPSDDAGAAGGVLSAVIQFGGAAGVGVVAMIFFGFLAGGADAQVDRTVPGLRASLSAEGLPASRQDQILTGFRACVDDQAGAVNPYEVPASCRATGLSDPAVVSALESTRRHNFSDAASRTLWYQVGALVLSAALYGLLPKRPSTPSPEATAAGQPADWQGSDVAH